MTEQVRIRMSAAEFEALPEQSQPTELIEGELVVRGTPTLNHQRVAGNIYDRLRDIVPNGEVFYAPVSVKLDDGNYYQPDVLWVAANGACKMNDDGLNGPPDLVVEVISPDTAKVDRGVKFQVYQSSGVLEYWIIEPELAFVEVWSLRDGSFMQMGVFSADETVASPALGQDVVLTGIFPSEG